MATDAYLRLRHEPPEKLASILTAGDIPPDNTKVAVLREALRRAFIVYQTAELNAGELTVPKLEALADQCLATARLLESDPSIILQVFETSYDQMLNVIRALHQWSLAAELKAETLKGGKRTRSDTTLFSFLSDIYYTLSGRKALSRSRGPQYRFIEACIQYLDLCPMVTPPTLFDRIKDKRKSVSGANAAY